MEIKLSDESGDSEFLAPFFNSLNNNEYIRENARPRLPEPRKGQMGLDVATITLLIGSGCDLGRLALEVRKCYREQRKQKPNVIVKTAGQSTKISHDDLIDLSEKNTALSRAFAGVADLQKSKCLLIGVGDYGRLSPLPGVRKNLEELRELLVDPEVWGIPEERLEVIDYPRDANTIREAVTRATKDATDTLLIYFAGHGRYDEKQGLMFALPDAARGKTDDDQNIRWQELAETIGGTSSLRTIAWLDCCYAGSARPDDKTEPQEDTELDEEAPTSSTVPASEDDPSKILRVAGVNRTYLFAATPRDEAAMSPEGEGCTAFTGEIVRFLRDGIDQVPPPVEYLTLNSLHRAVGDALSDKNLPSPERYDPGQIGQRPLFHNNKKPLIAPFEPPTPPKDPPTPPNSDETPPQGGSENPGTSRKPNWRLISYAAVGLLVLIGLVVYVLTPGPRVSGLDLAKYCTMPPGGAQPFAPADTYCVRNIDLNDACAFTYPDHSSGMRADRTSSDVNSTVCTGSGPNPVSYGGIPNMTGYCEDRTKVPGVTATANNPSSAWVCQVKINGDLACDQQNNRTGLLGTEQDDKTWNCYERHWPAG